ncbi:MAG TPA: hypothetical protein VF092_00120 [Longimicrobium sp.]
MIAYPPGPTGIERAVSPSERRGHGAVADGKHRAPGVSFTLETG